MKKPCNGSSCSPERGDCTGTFLARRLSPAKFSALVERLAPYDAFMKASQLSFAVRKLCPPVLPPDLDVTSLTLDLILRAHHHLCQIETNGIHADSEESMDGLLQFEADGNSLVWLEPAAARGHYLVARCFQLLGASPARRKAFAEHGDGDMLSHAHLAATNAVNCASNSATCFLAETKRLQEALRVAKAQPGAPKSGAGAALFSSIVTGRTAACAQCGAVQGLSICGGCRGAYYCSTACQQSAWQAHKAECRAAAEKL